MGEDSGRKLREFFLIMGEKKEDTVKSQMSLALWWFQGLSDSGSGTPAWDTIMTLSHPASPGSHEGKVDFCTSTCSGGRSGHQCGGGVLLLKDEATPIRICRRQGALDSAK